jgi:hypothetical protein
MDLGLILLHTGIVQNGLLDDDWSSMLFAADLLRRAHTLRDAHVHDNMLRICRKDAKAEKSAASPYPNEL